MQRKIDQTRRLAEKIAIAQELQEEKLDRMQKVDDMRDEEKRQNAIKVADERKRQKEALDAAKKA